MDAQEPPPVSTLLIPLFGILMFLGIFGLCVVLLSPSRDPVPSQIDRIETKLDQLLERP